MLYRSTADRFRLLDPGIRSLLVGLVAACTSFMAGAAVAVAGMLPLAGVVGLAGLATMAFAPSFLVLGSVLAVRAMTDQFSDIAVVAGLNGGALIGLGLIAGAGALMLRRLWSDEARGVGIGLLLVMAIGFWTLVGVIQFGRDPSFQREAVRSLSIVAVALLAANADRSITPRRMANIVILAALVPALMVLYEGLTNWQAVIGGLRPRGPLSHPNAAALLFSVAIPLAAWRWAYDGGGRRYLLIAAVLAAAIVVTRSMGGLAQAVVTLFVASLLLPDQAKVRMALGIGAVAIVVMFVADPFGISRVSELESVSLAGDELDRHDNSFEWRLVNWGALLEEWREEPWLGRGLGSTASLIRPLGHEPHSDPVRFLVEGGVAGASLYLAGYLLVVVRLRRLTRTGNARSYAVAVLAMLAGVSVHALVTHVSLNTQPMYVVAALLAWTLTLPTEDDPAVEPPGPALDEVTPRYGRPGVSRPGAGATAAGRRW
ncbi:MAG: O-antigen ligase family protein [Dehalococcoidia bacterium]|nr:O-antigen ligase family protein [Dehalococcoidia bacterium]